MIFHKKAALKNWIKEVIPWGWRRLRGFNFFLKKIPGFKNSPESINKNATLLKVTRQVEMSIYSSEAPTFPSEMEDWIKKIQEDSHQRFLLGNLLTPLIKEVEKNAAVIQCTVEQAATFFGAVSLCPHM
jgi:CRISPR/Cas system-associated endonuclease Cas3-HD